MMVQWPTSACCNGAVYPAVPPPTTPGEDHSCHSYSEREPLSLVGGGCGPGVWQECEGLGQLQAAKRTRLKGGPKK
jgi:hypothetical protein